MTICGFAELTLQAHDPVTLARFYTRGLGLTELSREPDRVWLAVGDSVRLGWWKPGAEESKDEGAAHVHFAVSVDPGTLSVLAQRLRAQGGDVEGPLEHDGGGRSLYIRDPEGNVVEAWDLFDRGETVHNVWGAAA